MALTIGLCATSACARPLATQHSGAGSATAIAKPGIPVTQPRPVSAAVPARPIRSPAPLPACYTASGAQADWVPDRRGARIVTVGSGRDGIVFAPISWGDACEWAGEAQRLAGLGYAVAALDWGSDRQQTVADAAQLLVSRGARRLVLVGGCMGGSVALGMATRMIPRPVGVAAISPYPGAALSKDRRDAYDGRVLLMGTSEDDLSSPRYLRGLAASLPARPEVLVLPGADHAAEIFDGPHRGLARTRLDAFLTRAFAGAAP